MLSYLWLLIKRSAVLVPGLVVLYVSVRNVFPYFHHRLPFAIALFVTYIAGAYVLVPALIRAWRIFDHPKHLPIYCVTPDGFASDPLNVGIIGSRTQLISAMESAGWSVAEPSTVRSILATALALALNRPYHGMPMSNLYLFGRKQDIGFELQRTDQGRGYRHHVRFWATTLDDIQPLSGAVTGRHRKSLDDKLLWAGAASLDIGITFMRHTLQFAHSVDPDTNRERDLIVKQLAGKKKAKLVDTIRLQAAYTLVNRAWFATLKTDGKMAILRLQ